MMSSAVVIPIGSTNWGGGRAHPWWLGRLWAGWPLTRGHALPEAVGESTAEGYSACWGSEGPFGVAPTSDFCYHTTQSTWKHTTISSNANSTHQDQTPVNQTILT